jgi:ATP-dependent RNA helicase DeaD
VRHFADVYESYVHRSGRTARAEQGFTSLTVLQPEEEKKKLLIFEKELGIKFSKFKETFGFKYQRRKQYLV